MLQTVPVLVYNILQTGTAVACHQKQETDKPLYAVCPTVNGRYNRFEIHI